MMNCGVIFPEPGYLQGLKDLLHAHGAYLAFDEVKTGITLAYGGASEVFGVMPDILCLAKAIGGGSMPSASLRAAARRKCPEPHAGSTMESPSRASTALPGFFAMVSEMTGSSALSSSTCTRLSGV